MLPVFRESFKSSFSNLACKSTDSVMSSVGTASAVSSMAFLWWIYINMSSSGGPFYSACLKHVAVFVRLTYQDDPFAAEVSRTIAESLV